MIKKNYLLFFLSLFIFLVMINSVSAQYVDYGFEVKDCEAYNEINPDLVVDCYASVAENNEDPKICLKNENVGSRDQCLIQLSYRLEYKESPNPKVCDYISEESAKSYCYERMAVASGSSESDLCLLSESTAVRCIQDIAGAYPVSNFKICNKIKEIEPAPEDIEKALDKCYFRASYDRERGPEGCWNIEDNSLRSECYRMRGIGFNFYWIWRLIAIILINSGIWIFFVMLSDRWKKDKTQIQDQKDSIRKYILGLIGLLVGVVYFIIIYLYNIFDSLIGFIILFVIGIPLTIAELCVSILWKILPFLAPLELYKLGFPFFPPAESGTFGTYVYNPFLIGLILVFLVIFITYFIGSSILKRESKIKRILISLGYIILLVVLGGLSLFMRIDFG